MIPVAPQPEPPTFEATVRSPGRSFLRHHPRPSSKQFKNKRFWQQCLPGLKDAYSDICAYSACWVLAEGTVDHFWPTSVNPDLAYEWSNYRLALAKLNSYKGDSTEILDPFNIHEGWFVMNFISFFVEPNVGLDARVETAVRRTIEVLRLNIDESFVKLRFSIVKEYAQGNFTLNFLIRRYPFIGRELKRQNLTETIKTYSFNQNEKQT